MDDRRDWKRHGRQGKQLSGSSSSPESGQPAFWSDGSTERRPGYIVGDFVSGKNTFKLRSAITQAKLDECESECNSNKECSWYYVNVRDKNCFLLRTKRQFLSDIGSKDFFAGPRRVQWGMAGHFPNFHQNYHKPNVARATLPGKISSHTSFRSGQWPTSFLGRWLY